LNIQMESICNVEVIRLWEQTYTKCRIQNVKQPKTWLLDKDVAIKQVVRL
jgi:hypothetical protein